MLDLHGEITVHDLFRSVENALDRALHGMLAAQCVHKCADQTEQKDIAESHKGGETDVLRRKGDPGIPLQKGQKQEHGACEHEGDQQEEDPEQPPKGAALLPFRVHHFNTAL